MISGNLNPLLWQLALPHHGIGEDEDSIAAQLSFMNREIKRNFIDEVKLRDAMDRTAFVRKTWINNDKPVVSSIVSEYTALGRESNVSR